MEHDNEDVQMENIAGENPREEDDEQESDNPVPDVQVENVNSGEIIMKADPSDGSDSENSECDSGQSCPICMDLWTNSGEHRLCCLKCGHLFGHSCILKWLQVSCNSTNRRCPQCNRKAALKDIRVLYARKLMSIDTTELDKLKEQLNVVTTEKNRLEMELSKSQLRQGLYEQQLTSMKSRIAELENQQLDITVSSRQAHKKFYLQKSITISKDGGCRVLDYNPWMGYLVVSEKSTNTLFSGYGIKKVDSEKFQARQFVFLHSHVIRDITFHSTQQSLLLSVGFDKCAKLVDIQNNTVVHTYQTECPLWSCCWSGDNPNTFFTGAQNGSITQFDVRQTSGAIDVLQNRGDSSPVVSLATVPSNSDTGITRGGFVACHLNTCYAYEQRDAKYIHKQIYLQGPFVSVRYDEKNNHALISSRPNARQPHARHIICTFEKDTEDTVKCNIVHTFYAGNSQQLLSRPCHVYIENDTLVAAHQESSSSISLWSISSGKQILSLPVSDPVVDTCSFESNNNIFLATLSSTKLRLYTSE